MAHLNGSMATQSVTRVVGTAPGTTNVNLANVNLADVNLAERYAAGSGAHRSRCAGAKRGVRGTPCILIHRSSVSAQKSWLDDVNGGRPSGQEKGTSSKVVDNLWKGHDSIHERAHGSSDGVISPGA